MDKEEKTIRVLYTILLVVSIFCNLLLGYYYRTGFEFKLMKFSFIEHNIDVYCEAEDDITVINSGTGEYTYKIGKNEFRSREDLYLVSTDGEINLSEIGGDTFIISRKSELIYPTDKTEK